MPVSANSLALSKLSCLPNNIEASISFSIEDSKSNKFSAIPATVPKFNPSFLASIAAAAIFCPPSFANWANVSVLSAISFNTCAGATPSALANAPTEDIRFIFVSIEAPLIASIDLSNLAALAPLIPNCPVIKPNLADTPADTTDNEPNSCTKPVTAASASCELPPTAFADKPAAVILPANLADSTADVPNDCLSSKALPTKSVISLTAIPIAATPIALGLLNNVEVSLILLPHASIFAWAAASSFNFSVKSGVSSKTFCISSTAFRYFPEKFFRSSNKSTESASPLRTLFNNEA